MKFSADFSNILKQLLFLKSFVIEKNYVWMFTDFAESFHNFILKE